MGFNFAQTKKELIDKEQLISVVVLLKKEKDETFVLLNERKPGKWELPGGKVEHCESSKDAAIREIKEETNIKIDPDKLVTIDEMMPEYKTDKKCSYYGYYVSENDEVKVGSDAKKLEWFSMDNLPNLLWQGKNFVNKTVKKMSEMKSPNKDIFIFVDIDGVLNKNNHKDEQKYYDNIYNLKEILKKDKIQLLNKLYKELNPTFVLSSYWRKHGSLHAFNNMFHDLGFEGVFSITTPFEGIEHIDRWKQIKKVLKKYNPEKYIILDDKPISDKKNFKNKYLVDTEENNGLTQKDIDRALELLNVKKASFNYRTLINSRKEN